MIMKQVEKEASMVINVRFSSFSFQELHFNFMVISWESCSSSKLQTHFSNSQTLQEKLAKCTYAFKPGE